MFDKRFMLEESLRMPFVVRYPREIGPGTVLNDIMLNVDFAELFLDYAGAQIPGTMQGRSFRRNLIGKTVIRTAFSVLRSAYSCCVQRASRNAARGTQNAEWSYGLVRMGRKPDECWELYDLQNDPREQFNVYDNPEHTETIAGLKRRLEQLRREYGDTEDPLKA